MRWTRTDLYGPEYRDPIFVHTCGICGLQVGDMIQHLLWHNDAIQDWQTLKPIPKGEHHGTGKTTP